MGHNGCLQLETPCMLLNVLGFNQVKCSLTSTGGEGQFGRSLGG